VREGALDSFLLPGPRKCTWIAVSWRASRRSEDICRRYLPWRRM